MKRLYAIEICLENLNLIARLNSGVTPREVDEKSYFLIEINEDGQTVSTSIASEETVLQISKSKVTMIHP